MLDNNNTVTSFTSSAPVPTCHVMRKRERNSVPTKTFTTSLVCFIPGSKLKQPKMSDLYSNKVFFVTLNQ